MRIDHGCADIRVSKQFLNKTDVLSRLKQMSREAMTHGMAGNPFVNTGGSGAVPDRFLQAGFMDMMPAGYSRPGVC